VAEAVVRRLLSISPGELTLWQERLEPEAEALLNVTPYDPARLARIERDMPLTRAAALAALRLADFSLEGGRTEDVHTWLKRARRHTNAQQRGRSPMDDLDAGLDQREALLAALAVERNEGSEPWQKATELEATLAVRLESVHTMSPDARPVPLGRRVAPGAAFFEDGSLLVQSPRGLGLFRPDVLSGAGGDQTRRHRYVDLLKIPPVRPFALPSSGGWPLLPCTEGMHAVLVVDRGRPGRTVGNIPLSANGNHLVCLILGPGGQLRLCWRLSQEGLVRPGLATLPWDQAMGTPGRFEFQPGPITGEGRVFVQARGLPHPDEGGVLKSADVMLFALDLETGGLIWSRPLTRPADLRQAGRAIGAVPTTGMPLSLAEGVLVAGTNVGLVCAFEALDGRHLWSVRTQRREVGEVGWPGSRRPLATDSAGGSGAVLVAPFDSTHAYALSLRPGPDSPLFTSVPQSKGTLVDLAAGDAQGGWLFLGRDGRHQALRTLDSEHGLRSSLYLGAGEVFEGPALTSAERVLVTSGRGLYLFDRTRECYLMTVGRMQALGAGAGGRVVAQDGVVAVTGRDTLWVFQAR
jgi:outer membrane protein assembly factor BamB